MDVVYHINRLKDRNHIIIPIDEEGLKKNNPQFLHDKSQKKLGIKGTHLNITKAVYNRHYTKWEKTESISSKT